MVTTNVHLDASDDFPKSESGVRATFSDPKPTRTTGRAGAVPAGPWAGKKEDVYPSPEQISLNAVR
jgi:hypothetical protein